MADLIDRDAVIKQIAETQDKISSGIEDVTFYRAIKIIRNAPAVNRWIPCSERLPEKAGEYLVTYHPCYWDDVEWSKRYVGIDTFRGKSTWAKKKYQRVIAWMPLPDAYEPPKE